MATKRAWEVLCRADTEHFVGPGLGLQGEALGRDPRDQKAAGVGALATRHHSLDSYLLRPFDCLNND